MQRVLSNYGLFIVGAIIGVVLLLVIYSLTTGENGIIKNNSFLDGKYSVEVGNNPNAKTLPRPELVVNDLMVELGDDSFDPKECIESAKDVNGADLTDSVVFLNLDEIDIDTEGTYRLKLFLRGSNDMVSKATVTVRVFETNIIEDTELPGIEIIDDGIEILE